MVGGLAAATLVKRLALSRLEECLFQRNPCARTRCVRNMESETMKGKRTHRHRRTQKRVGSPRTLIPLNAYAAGIDVGSKSHYVAVPEQADPEPVREFSSFTADLYRLAQWLEACGVRTVAMESTGVYWIALFEILEARGFEVKLVNARHVKNVPGRKSDVLDCQWLQQLHTYGLLHGAFRPDEEICALRAYLRQRANLVSYAASHIQHLQKALVQMNVQLHNVVSDITGVTGMRIIRAIVAGEHNPKVLARHRDGRCKHTKQTIAKSLQGNYREEHLFALGQALELLDYYQHKIADCDERIEKQLSTFKAQVDLGTHPLAPHPKATKRAQGNAPRFDLRTHLYRISGVDLSAIDGIDAYTALKVISEIGLDMSRWPSGKHFCSWLSLAPGTKITGGKRLSGKTKASANRAAGALRLAAQALFNSQSALGAYLRRQRARLGAPKAITATAHKLARLIYSMLKYGTAYVDAGQDCYEQQYHQRVVRNLKRKARAMGYELVKTPPEPLTA